MRSFWMLGIAVLLAACVPGGYPGYHPGAAVAVPKSTLNLAPGESRALGGYLRDQAGAGPTSGLVWTSSAPGVVEVDPLSGVATARTAGNAIITVYSQTNPAAAAALLVVVGAGDHIGARVVEVSPLRVDLPVGQQKPLQAAVKSAAGAIGGAVSWTSSDPSVVAVDAITGVVVALKPGQATVTAALLSDPRVTGAGVVVVGAVPLAPPVNPGPGGNPGRNSISNEPGGNGLTNLTNQVPPGDIAAAPPIPIRPPEIAPTIPPGLAPSVPPSVAPSIPPVDMSGQALGVVPLISDNARIEDPVSPPDVPTIPGRTPIRVSTPTPAP